MIICYFFTILANNYFERNRQSDNLTDFKNSYHTYNGLQLSDINSSVGTINTTQFITYDINMMSSYQTGNPGTSGATFNGNTHPKDANLQNWIEPAYNTQDVNFYGSSIQYIKAFRQKDTSSAFDSSQIITYSEPDGHTYYECTSSLSDGMDYRAQLTGLHKVAGNFAVISSERISSLTLL